MSNKPNVCVLADDLIWASRLVAAVERADANPMRAVSADAMKALLADAATDVQAAVIDLNGRRYDGVETVRLAAGTGLPVVAVGQHEDLELRRRALDAGAQRVYSYNKLFRDGPAVVLSLLAGRQTVSQVATPEPGGVEEPA